MGSDVKPFSSSAVENLFICVAEKYGLKVAELSSGSRRREVVEARGIVSYVAVRIGGLGPTKLGKLLRVSRQSVLRGIQIGEQLVLKNRWEVNWFSSQ